MARTPRTPGASSAPAEAPESKPVDADVQLPEAGSDLPDQSEIDPTKITRAVMSKQGWVCPAQAPKGI